jgi:hypothetical protein
MSEQKACFCDYEEENGPLSCVLDGVRYVYDECAYAAELPEGAGKEECIFWCPDKAKELENAKNPPFDLVLVLKNKQDPHPIGIDSSLRQWISVDKAKHLVNDLQLARSEIAEYIAEGIRYASKETGMIWPEKTVIVTHSTSELAELDDLLGWPIMIMDIPSGYPFFVAFPSEELDKAALQKSFLEFLDTNDFE